MATVTNPKGASDRPAPSPVIIEVGERSKKQINKIRQGRGQIMKDIDRAMAGLRSAGDVPEDAQVVIVVVREGPKSSDSCWW